MKLKEERKCVRTDLSWPVSIWVPAINRFLNGKTVNISEGGVRISTDFEGVCRVGQVVEVNFPRTEILAKEKGQYSRIKSGKIVRMDTTGPSYTLIERGAIHIAVQFDKKVTD